MRITEKRIEKWQSDILKAERLLRKVETEIVGARLQAKGGRLSHLTECLKCLRAIGTAIVLMRDADSPLVLLEASERKARNKRAAAHATAS